MSVQLHNWLFVPSPILGPSSWQPVATCLERTGGSTWLARTTMTTTADRDHVTPWLEEVAKGPWAGSERPVVVVGHSAACPRIPLLVHTLLERDWPVSSYVCVDGRFPDGRAFTESAEHFGAMLDGLVRPDDYLPPWPRWWGSLVEGLVVDPAARDKVFSEAMPIPRHWFDQACPVPELPDEVRPAFLSFGAGYEESRDRAHQAGWLTHRLVGDHLHQVVAPQAVADTLRAMVTCLDSA